MSLGAEFHVPEGWSLMLLRDVPIGWQYTGYHPDSCIAPQVRTQTDSSQVIVLAREVPKGPLSVELPRDLAEWIDERGAREYGSKPIPFPIWNQLVTAVQCALIEEDQ